MNGTNEGEPKPPPAARLMGDDDTELSTWVKYECCGLIRRLASLTPLWPRLTPSDGGQPQAIHNWRALRRAGGPKKREGQPIWLFKGA